MPDDLFEFLLAMAVMQDYQVQLIVAGERNERDPDYAITFRMNEKFKYFEPCLRVLLNNTPIYDYSGWDEESRGDFECYIRFYTEDAKKLALNGNIHMTEAYGIITGTLINALKFGTYPDRYPELGELKLKAPERTQEDLYSPRAAVSIHRWDKVETDKFVEYLSNNYPQLQLNVFDEMTENSEVLVNYVNNFDFVIGKNSPTTYLACALKKSVIEIFDSMEDLNLYGGVVGPTYQAIVGNPSADYVWITWETVWADFLEHLLNMKYQGLQVQTECVPSTAENVAEKSSDNIVLP